MGCRIMKGVTERCMARLRLTQRRPLRINALLKSIYTDLRHPASFSSPYTLFRAAKQKNPNILFKDVKDVLVLVRDPTSLH